MSNDEMTLADHAEAWWREKGNTVPPRDTLQWSHVYANWITFAFSPERSLEDDGKISPRS